MITPALAPTATRGVVRLIFDADGQRYVVAREARRSGGKTSRVSMHASRLERLHDPDDLDGDGDVLAADSEVTKAVENLLGLSYDHFTTCVALPQGEFAEFLHAKASDRQDILSSLLGYQLYDELQSRANSRARDKRAARDALEATLAGYDDATEQQVSDLTGRADRLNQLQTWLTGTGLPNLKQAALAVTDTGDRLGELTAQQQALAAVQVPPDVAALDADLATATSTLAEATKVHDAAEAADTLAAEKISALPAPARAPDPAPAMGRPSQTNTDLPALEADVTDAVTAHGEAKQATEAAEQHTEQLRVAAEHAADTADQAQQAVTSTAEQTATLATITVPHDLGELTTALTALRARHAELDTETDAAEDAYRAAQAALGSAPSEATLSTGRRPATTVHDTLTADLAAWNDRDQAASALATAASAAVTAAAALETARATLDAARLADEAGACAPTYCPGSRARSASSRSEPSPPGTTPATSPPRRKSSRPRSPATTRRQRSTLASTATTGTRPRPAPKPCGTSRQPAPTCTPPCAACTPLATNQTPARAGGTGAAAPSQSAASHDRRDSRTRPDGIAGDRSAPRSRLIPPAATSPGWPTPQRKLATSSTPLPKPRRLQQAVTAADIRRSNASAARRTFDRDSLDLDERSRAAATALQRTRDTVASLGAPLADTADLIAAWDTLTRWAAAEHATRSAQLPALREAAARHGRGRGHGTRRTCPSRSSS